MGYDPRQRRADTSNENVEAYANEIIDAGRIRHIRDICQRSMEYDKGAADYTFTTGGLTDRQWLARSVLNILEGNIDAQIMQEAGQ